MVQCGCGLSTVRAETFERAFSEFKAQHERLSVLRHEGASPDRRDVQEYLAAAREALEALSGRGNYRAEDPNTPRLYRETLARLLEVADAAGAAKTSEFIAALQPPTGEIDLDPEAGPLQECGFFPSAPEKVVFQEFGTGLTKTPSADASIPVPSRVLSPLIPPEYRLAELLGLGKNLVRGEASYIDPKLSFSIGMFAGHVIESRVWCEIIGVFQSEKFPVELQTFRRGIASRSRLLSSVIRTGREIKPKAYAAHDISLWENHGNAFVTLWARERLGKKLADESRRIDKTTCEEALEIETRDVLMKAIEERLDQWRKQIVAAQCKHLVDTPNSAQLDETLRALRDHEARLHSRHDDCLVEPVSERLPNRMQLRAEIESRNGARMDRWLPRYVEQVDLQLGLRELHVLVHESPEALRNKAVSIYLAAAGYLSRERCQP